MLNTINSSGFAPADEDIVEQTVAFLLRYTAEKRPDDNFETMSRVAAKRVIKGLKRSGFVLMKRKAQPTLWD